MLSLSASFPGAELCSLAEQVCHGRVSGLYLQHTRLSFPKKLTARHVQQFLDTLQRSSLTKLFWDPPRHLRERDIQPVRNSLSSLVGSLCSLRLVWIRIRKTGAHPDVASEDLATVAWRRGAELSFKRHLCAGIPDCSDCCA
ncbi:unnamed protein product [Symbiodinium natans]|uniref:Uncharacterized protein n=1 Tax=Symbiodinium natans TaxID=878477 RepID=A0A812N0Z6_9DINO|nr:unnamed protein product [Symbiodinium natans]